MKDEDGKPTIVIDPTKVNEFTLITSSGDPKHRQNRWLNVTLQKTETPTSAEREAGFHAARNLNDPGNAPLDLSPHVADNGAFLSADVALDVDSAALDEVSSVQLLDGDLERLLLFVPHDLDRQQGETTASLRHDPSQDQGR